MVPQPPRSLYAKTISDNPGKPRGFLGFFVSPAPPEPHSDDLASGVSRPWHRLKRFISLFIVFSYLHALLTPTYAALLSWEDTGQHQPVHLRIHRFFEKEALIPSF